MKQSIYLLMLFLALALNGQAQKVPFYLKGNSHIGAAAHGRIGSRDIFASSSLNIRAAHFIADRLAIGADLGFLRFSGTQRSIEIGPYVRYYLLDEKIAPLIEVNSQYGRFRVNDFNFFSQANYAILGLSGGLAYTGNELGNFGAEVVINYRAFIPNPQGSRRFFPSTVFRVYYFF